MFKTFVFLLSRHASCIQTTRVQMVLSATDCTGFIKAFFTFCISYSFMLHAKLHFHSPFKTRSFFPAAFFVKFTDTRQFYVQIPCTESEPNRRINVENMKRNLFKTLS